MFQILIQGTPHPKQYQLQKTFTKAEVQSKIFNKQVKQFDEVMEQKKNIVEHLQKLQATIKNSNNLNDQEYKRIVQTKIEVSKGEDKSQKQLRLRIKKVNINQNICNFFKNKSTIQELKKIFNEQTNENLDNKNKKLDDIEELQGICFVLNFE